MKKILAKIFSVKDSYIKDKLGLIIKKYKVCCILGIKFKYKQKLSQEYQSLSEVLHRVIDVANENAVCKLITDTTNNRLLCFENGPQLYIFTPEFLRLDCVFVYNYLNNPVKGRTFNQIKFLDKNSDLYKEHIEYFRKGELCWKYVHKFNGIYKSAIYQENQDIYFKYDFLGLENAIFNDTFIWANPSPRKYIRGITVYDYLATLNPKEQIELIKKFFDYIFEEYKLEGSDLISGKIADCHFRNFIISADNKFNLVDCELESKMPLEKGYCIYCALTFDNKNIICEKKNLYKYFINLYNLPNNLKLYKKTKIEREVYSVSDKEREKRELANQTLIQKYFTKNMYS